MLASVQPRAGDGAASNTIDTATLQPRTRVDSGHVVDGDGIVRRLPKLAVRNQTENEDNDADQATTTNSYPGSEDERSAPASSNSSQRLRTPLSNRSLSDESGPRRRQCVGPRQSDDSSKAAPANVQTATKKKRGGMLNFLTLKEPSTSAWADFAEAEKEKARLKSANGCISTARPGSSQKLPGFVPKVNSKWDGLPDSVHRKSNESKAANRANRSSVISNATRDTTWTPTSSGSSNSRAQKQAFATLSGRPVKDSMQSTERTNSSQGSGKQPPALALDFESGPAAENVENTDENRPQTFLRDPSPTPQLHELPDSTVPMSPPELEGDDMQYFQELEASPPHSPTTPPGDGSESRPALVGIHYPELDSVAKEAELYGDSTNDAVVRANSSRRPVNFSRPQLKKPAATPSLAVQTESHYEESAIPDPLPTADGVLLSPTLKNPGGEIEPFLTDTFALHSRETGHIPQRVASTLQKGKKIDETAAEQEEETPVSPISPVSPLENPSQPSTIPDVMMRPPTADSTNTAEPERARSPLESQSQLSLAPSVVPSELSETWRMSPKERLGLGSKLRKSEVSPWEADDLMLDDANRGRLSPGPDSRVRRLSWRSIGGKK